MHVRTSIKYILLSVVMSVTPIFLAAQTGDDSEAETPPPIPSSGNPEYKIKSLPNDTFKPSEKISEDFPVPFPVDI